MGYVGPYGTPGVERASVSSAARGALEALAKNVVDSGLCDEKFEGANWERFLDVRTVDYKGGEIRVAKSFSWEKNIEPALPPVIGSIPLAEICERGTLNYVLNSENYLLPEELRVHTKPPKTFVQDDSWEQVCSGLLARTFWGFKRRAHFGRYGNLQAHDEPGPGEPAVPQLGRRREYPAVLVG